MVDQNLPDSRLQATQIWVRRYREKIPPEETM